MRVLVCGSRSWESIAKIGVRFVNLPDEPIEILHGGARGADKLADLLARKMGFAVRVFPAQWRKHGRRAGILRNIAMLDEKPDLVLAFWDGFSRGTKHTIAEAERRGIPTEVYEP